jgi:hypothetical protein
LVVLGCGNIMMVDATFTTSGVDDDIMTPHCFGMVEDPSAASERKRLSSLRRQKNLGSEPTTPLAVHILHGLAYTIGSALGSSPPTVEACLIAFTTTNKADLTAGARAWSKHFHRSLPDEIGRDKEAQSSGWWGTPAGSVAVINEKALVLFWKIMENATWRNLHWLPHQVLVYEVRVAEGYGMRWSQDHSRCGEEHKGGEHRRWVLRGFVEPMIENGHELGWKH